MFLLIFSLAVIGSRAQNAAPVFPTPNILSPGQSVCSCTAIEANAANRPTCVGGSSNGNACNHPIPYETGVCPTTATNAGARCPATVPGGVACTCTGACATARGNYACTRVPRSTGYGYGACNNDGCECLPDALVGAGTAGLLINTACTATGFCICPIGVSPVVNTRCNQASTNLGVACTAATSAATCGAVSQCTLPNCLVPGICTARSVHADGPYQQSMFCDGGPNADGACTVATQAADCGAGNTCIWSQPVCSGGPNAGKRCDMTNVLGGRGTGSAYTHYQDCPGDKILRTIGYTGAAPSPTPFGMCSGGANYLGPCEGISNAVLATQCPGGNNVACMGVVGIRANTVCRPAVMGRCVGGSNPGVMCPASTPAGDVIPGGADCIGNTAPPVVPAGVCTFPATRTSPVNPCLRKTSANTVLVGAANAGDTCNFDEKCTSEGIGNATLSQCIPIDNEVCVRYTTLGKKGSDGGNIGMDTLQAPNGCRSTEKCCDGDCCSYNEGCMTQESGPFYYNFQSYMAESVARNDWKMPDATEIKNKPRRCMNQNTWMNATAGLKVIVLPVFGILLTAFCFMQANKNKTGEMGENMGPMLMIFFSFWLVFSYHIMVALLSILVATATMVASPAWTSWVLFFQILFFWWTVGGASFFLPSAGLYGNNFITDMVSAGPNQVNTMATNCATYFNFFMYQPSPGNMKYMSNPARTTWGYCGLEFVSFGATFAVFSLLAYFATIVQTTIRCLTSGDSSRASQALTAAKV